MKYSFDGRYSDNLKNVLSRLGAKRELFCDFLNDYQGFVDVAVLLSGGRVFKYYYSYGSCSECDEWEDRMLSDGEIEQEMLRDAVIFYTEEQYKLSLKKK